MSRQAIELLTAHVSMAAATAALRHYYTDKIQIGKFRILKFQKQRL